MVQEMTLRQRHREVSSRLRGSNRKTLAANGRLQFGKSRKLYCIAYIYCILFLWNIAPSPL